MHQPERFPVSEDEIEGMTTWTLIRLGHHLERLLTDALRPCGLTPLQYGVLAHLSARPALTQSALADAVLVRPQSMQHHLNHLVQLDLVERSARRGKGQRNPVHLTAGGLAALRQAHRAIVHANSTAALGLTGDEHRSLDVIAHHLLAVEALQ